GVRRDRDGQPQGGGDDGVAASGVDVGAAGPGDVEAVGVAVEAGVPQGALGFFQAVLEGADVAFDILVDHRPRDRDVEADRAGACGPGDAEGVQERVRLVQVEVAGIDVTHDAVEQPPALLYGAAAVAACQVLQAAGVPPRRF